MEEKRHVFTYGTLMIPEVFTTLMGKSFPFMDATLEGYCRLAVTDRPYPGIIDKVGSSTDGRLYREVDRQSIDLLDRFEGRMYTRHRRYLRTAEQQDVDGEVYLVNKEYEPTLSVSPWDLQWFKDEWLEAYLRTCKEFRVRWLGSLPYRCNWPFDVQ